MHKIKAKYEGYAIKDIPVDTLLSVNMIARALHVKPQAARVLTERDDFPPSIVIGKTWPKWRAGAVAKYLDRIGGKV